MNAITKSQAMPASMNTKEIAKVSGKNHGHVLRETRVQLVTLFARDHVDSVIPAEKAEQRAQFIRDNVDKLFNAVFRDDPHMDHQQNQGFALKWDSRGYLASVELDQELTLTLVSGYDILLRNRVIKRLGELERKLAAPTAIPYSVGKTDTLTEAQQEELRAILHGGAEQLPMSQRGAFLTKGWSKLKAHFKVPYREIPRHEFTEAVSIASRHVAELQVPALPAPAQKVDQLTQALDSMNLLAGSVADLTAAVMTLVTQPRDSPRQAGKGEGLTAPTVSPSSEKSAAPTAQVS